MMTFVQSCFRRMVMILSIHALTSTDVFQSIGMREEMYIGIVAGKKWDRRGNSGLDEKFLREREQNWRRRKPPDSQKLNSPQQAACIRLKLNVLKTGHFGNRSESDLGAGGRPTSAPLAPALARSLTSEEAEAARAPARASSDANPAASESSLPSLWRTWESPELHRSPPPSHR